MSTYPFARGEKDYQAYAKKFATEKFGYLNSKKHITHISENKYSYQLGSKTNTSFIMDIIKLNMILIKFHPVFFPCKSYISVKIT
jgi:hypothetical protein